MKRSAWAFSLLGLVGFGAPAFAQDTTTKTEKKEQYQSSPTKEKSERSMKTDTAEGTGKSDTSVTSETKQKTEGTTDATKKPAEEKKTK